MDDARSEIMKVIFARVLLLFFIAFGLLVRLFTSEQIEGFLQTIPYRCPLRWITGWKCAFCGMTHSWIAIFRGDFVTSFRENIFGLPLWIAALLLLIFYSFGKKLPFSGKPILIGSLVVMILYAVIRNII